jgi:hypothetical protein
VPEAPSTGGGLDACRRRLTRADRQTTDRQLTDN